MRDLIEEAFLEAWNRKGRRYLTRSQIARLFGKSLFWVQWMYVKSGAAPRKRAPSVVERERTGVDHRLKYIEEMKLKSAMNAAIKKLMIRTYELSQASRADKDFLRRITYLGRLIETVNGHINTVEEFDPEWKTLKEIEGLIDYSKSIYSAALEKAEIRKK